eukprot:7946254-Pyramimonas_sp.AAC.1
MPRRCGCPSSPAPDSGWRGGSVDEGRLLRRCAARVWARPRAASASTRVSARQTSACCAVRAADASSWSVLG